MDKIETGKPFVMGCGIQDQELMLDFLADERRLIKIANDINTMILLHKRSKDCKILQDIKIETKRLIRENKGFIKKWQDANLISNPKMKIIYKGFWNIRNLHLTIKNIKRFIKKEGD